jgi:hypothetical protein
MAVTSVPRSSEGNLGLLEAKMEREMFRQLFFARFTGFTTKDQRTGDTVTPSSPIVAKRELAQEGYDHLKVPMLRKLIGAATYGDVQLEGNAEAQVIYYMDAYINQIRHGVAPPPRM